MAGTACDNGSKARNGAESLAAAQNLAKRLAVVVVTYRRQHLLGELFDSLAELTTHPWRIYVVDNENSQDTQTRVRDFGERLIDAWDEPDDGAERVVYLPQPVNVGCSAGFNAGMKRAYHDGAEWFWLVDDDVAVLSDAVETLAPWTGAHDVIQGARFDFFGEDFPQPRDLNVAFGTPVLSPPRFGRAGYRVTNVVSFEGALVKRSIVSAIGLPDPRFFITTDDVVYGYCASKVTNPIMIPAKVLRKTCEKTEYDIAGHRAASRRCTTRHSSTTHITRRAFMTIPMRTIGPFTTTAIGEGEMPLTIENNRGHDVGIETIHASLDAGCRHIDTAWAYYTSGEED